MPQKSLDIRFSDYLLSEEKGKLHPSPAFQRRQVWAVPRNKASARGFLTRRASPRTDYRYKYTKAPANAGANVSIILGHFHKCLTQVFIILSSRTACQNSGMPHAFTWRLLFTVYMQYILFPQGHPTATVLPEHSCELDSLKNNCCRSHLLRKNPSGL